MDSVGQAPDLRTEAEPRSGIWWGSVVVLIVCSLYVFSWWNRYLQPTIGSEIYGASAIQRGDVPYRDFYYPIPPGPIFARWLVSQVLGPQFLNAWFLGAVLRIAAMICLYFWLIRVCRPVSAAWATVTTCFVSSGDLADFPGSYNYQVFVWAVFAGYFASKAIETAKGNLWAGLAGLMLAAGLLTKQTTGVAIALVTLFGTAWCGYRVGGWKRCLVLAASQLAGTLLPCAVLAVWLWHHEALAECIDQLFITGPSSKGGLWGSLARIFVLTARVHELQAAALAAAMAWLVFHLLRGTEVSHRPVMALLALLTVLVLVASQEQLTLRILLLAAVYVSLVFNFIVAVQALRTGENKPETNHQLLLGGIGFMSSFSMSLSWPAFEPMALPSLALTIGLVLDAPGRGLKRPALLAACLVLIAVAVERKITVPAVWGYWFEPPLGNSSVEPSLPELKGFYLSPTTARFLDDIVRLIRTHTAEDEPILVYPHMPILYELSGRHPATFCVMHWPDVCPDSLARREADYLRRHPPSLIIAMEIPDDYLRFQELAFRDGQRSGQRELRDTIAAIVKDYDLVETFTAPGSEFSINVWVRPKR